MEAVRLQQNNVIVSVNREPERKHLLCAAVFRYTEECVRVCVRGQS